MYQLQRSSYRGNFSCSCIVKELRVACQGLEETRAPVAQTLQSVRQTCPCTTVVRFPSCGIFTPTRTIPVNQRVETTV
jgi:hypothetical protein